MSDRPATATLASDEGFRLLRQWSLALDAAARGYPDTATTEAARQVYRQARDWYHQRGEPIPLELSGGPDIQIQHRAKTIKATRRRRILLYAIAAAAVALFVLLIVRGR